MSVRDAAYGELGKMCRHANGGENVVIGWSWHGLVHEVRGWNEDMLRMHDNSTRHPQPF
jgi:hypothetical protein